MNISKIKPYGKVHYNSINRTKYLGINLNNKRRARLVH